MSFIQKLWYGFGRYEKKNRKQVLVIATPQVEDYSTFTGNQATVA